MSAWGPASQSLAQRGGAGLWGGLAEGSLRRLLSPGDPDAAVGCPQLDRPGEQHCVRGADEGLRRDAQGGDGWETGAEGVPHPGLTAGSGPGATSAAGVGAPTTVGRNPSQGRSDG